LAEDYYKDNLIVNGDPANVFDGGMLLPYIMQLGIDIGSKHWKDVIRKHHATLFFNYEDLDCYSYLIDIIETTSANRGFKIETVFDFVWWYKHNFHWMVECLNMLKNFSPMLIKFNYGKKYWYNKFIPFFDTKILYRSYNLGCNLGVVSAFDWFFSQVDFGVVIEDDCFPADDLLDQLNKFNQNKINYQKQQVFIATGHNPFLRIKQDSISKYMLIGAWATWAEVWKEVRLNYFKLSLPTTKNIISEKRNLIESVYWWVNSSRAKLGYLDTWDGIFNDKAWNLGFKCLIPENNLVTNFGFRSDGTHTKNNTETTSAVITGTVNKGTSGESTIKPKVRILHVVPYNLNILHALH
jgi:hypothetical protein